MTTFYAVQAYGDRFAVYVVRPPSYLHPEPRRAVIAKRDTREQAESVVTDSLERDAEYSRTIRAGMRQ